MISKSEDVREWLRSLPTKDLKRACKETGVSYYNTVMPFLNDRKTITLKVLDRIREQVNEEVKRHRRKIGRCLV